MMKNTEKQLQKILFIITVLISTSNADTDINIFNAKTNEEKIIAQQNLLKMMGNTAIEIVEGAGRLIVSPVTDKIKDDKKKKKESIENNEREIAKKKLMQEMNN